MQSLAISDATAREILDNLPGGLSEERKIVVKKACSLVAVYSDNSHIGIVAGRKDNRSLLVIHCSAGTDNVVITDEEGFVWTVKVLG